MGEQDIGVQTDNVLAQGHLVRNLLSLGAIGGAALLMRGQPAEAAAEAAATKGKQLLAAAAAGSTSDVAQLIVEGAPHDFSEKAPTRQPLSTAPHGLTRQA